MGALGPGEPTTKRLPTHSRSPSDPSDESLKQSPSLRPLCRRTYARRGERFSMNVYDKNEVSQGVSGPERHRWTRRGREDGDVDGPSMPRDLRASTTTRGSVPYHVEVEGIANPTGCAHRPRSGTARVRLSGKDTHRGCVTREEFVFWTSLEDSGR